MTAPAPGADGPSPRPRTAQHFSVAPVLDTPEGYVAPGMPGVPVTGYTDTPTPHHRAPRRRTALALTLALLATLLSGLAYGCAPLRAADSLGWLTIAQAGLIALPLGRLGGRNPLLPPLGALLATTALLLGQLTQHLRLLHATTPTPHPLLPQTLTTWRTDLRPLDLAFYTIALIGGFLLTRRSANHT
ncbi:hypothetical protein ACIQWA_34070 [Kitasatospora sp. NPDC098652]|uniref:hypothetical protein n=1 Tax=Kitasatospora sp. NPDC098652 TaxID=3364095 RepID=UPI0038027197